jgi:hypothetical protein
MRSRATWPAVPPAVLLSPRGGCLPVALGGEAVADPLGDWCGYTVADLAVSV